MTLRLSVFLGFLANLALLLGVSPDVAGQLLNFVSFVGGDLSQGGDMARDCVRGRWRRECLLVRSLTFGAERAPAAERSDGGRQYQD